LKIYNSSGQSVGDYEIEQNCIELEKGSQAVHDVVVAYLASLRAGTACTKNRSQVRGGGAKPFRQKGTGRARPGSSRSPIWRGGGTIFGPKPRSYNKHVNKKVRKLALKRAFSERLQEGSVIILDEISVPEGKTKHAIKLINDLGLKRKTLFIVDDYDEKVDLATRNIENVLLIKAASVNVYQMLHFDNIVFAENAIDIFTARIQ
jgi:large subunit ribosomal protein L4